MWGRQSWRETSSNRKMGFLDSDTTTTTTFGNLLCDTCKCSAAFRRSGGCHWANKARERERESIGAGNTAFFLPSAQNRLKSHPERCEGIFWCCMVMGRGPWNIHGLRNPACKSQMTACHFLHCRFQGIPTGWILPSSMYILTCPR